MRPEGERELLADWFSRVQYLPELDWTETPVDYLDEDDPDADGVVAAVRPPVDGDDDGRVDDGRRRQPAKPSD